MRNATHTLECSDRSVNWKTYYLSCENVKSDLTLYSRDLKFLQNLLDTHFDEMVKNGNLDEMRESLIRFQDLCYNYDHLKKRAKDQLGNLNDLINDTFMLKKEVIIAEQIEIEKKMGQLTTDLKLVEKEILSIANHTLGNKTKV